MCLIRPVDPLLFFFCHAPTPISLELVGDRPEPTRGKIFSVKAMSCSRHCFAFPISAPWSPIRVDPMVSNLKKIIFKLIIWHNSLINVEAYNLQDNDSSLWGFKKILVCCSFRQLEEGFLGPCIIGIEYTYHYFYVANIFFSFLRIIQFLYCF